MGQNRPPLVLVLPNWVTVKTENGNIFAGRQRPNRATALMIPLPWPWSWTSNTGSLPPASRKVQSAMILG